MLRHQKPHTASRDTERHLEGKITTDAFHPSPAPVVYKISGPMGGGYLYTTAEAENSAVKFSKESVPPLYNESRSSKIAFPTRHRGLSGPSGPEPQKSPKRVRKGPRGLRPRGAPESTKSAPRSPKRAQKESGAHSLGTLGLPGA